MIQISLLNISSGLSMCRLFVQQVTTTHLRDRVRGLFLDLCGTFWVFLPPIPQFMVSLLKFSYQTLLYLIKPTTMECPMTAVDVLLFASRSATCLLCFSSIPFFIKSFSRVDGSPKKRLLLCDSEVFISTLKHFDGGSGAW